MKTKVIHIKNSTGIEEEYIGRSGKGKSGYFGNPYRVGQKCSRCGTVHHNGGETIPCYREYLLDRLKHDEQFRKEVRALHGKTLVCFCKPNPCHGDILAFAIEMLNLP